MPRATRSGLKPLLSTRNLVSASSSTLVCLISTSAAGATSGVLNSVRACSKSKASGMGYLVLSSRAKMISRLPCSLMSFNAVLGPMPLVASGRRAVSGVSGLSVGERKNNTRHTTRRSGTYLMESQ